jgi:hypothetical protein
MSCETSTNKVGRIAGVKAGLSAMACKFGQAVGPMAGKALEQVARNKTPILVGGLALGGAAAIAAGAIAAPAPVRQRAKDAAAAAGQKAAGAVDAVRQAAGGVAASVQDTAVAAGEKATGALASAGQVVSNATAPVRDAAAAAGQRVSGAAADALGAYADKLDQVADAVGTRVAPIAGKALRVANSPLAGTAGGIARYAAFARNPALAPVAATVGAIASVSNFATGAAATRVARISRSGLAGTVVQDKRQLLFFKGKEAVNLWKSSLTRRLNRADLLGSHRLTGDGVYASDGVMFETGGGRTWHRGTSVVSTSAGQRTLTHLQSLNLPAQHYYFDSRIGDEQAVGIATGRVDPRKVPGFVGGISPGEALCPGWAGAKRAMINSVLYWGERKT